MSEEIIIVPNCINDWLVAYNEGTKRNIGKNHAKALEDAKDGAGKKFYLKGNKFIFL